MPSRPSLQAWAKTVGPSPSICSLNRMPGLALATVDASVALRTASGSRRRWSPFSSMWSKAYRNMPAVANEIERGDAVVIAGDRLAVDDAGAQAKAGQHFDDQREAARLGRCPMLAINLQTARASPGVCRGLSRS